MLDEITAAVKKKKELAGLADDYVKGKIEKILKKENKIKEKISTSKSFKEFSRSKEYKELKSIVREELRKVYGVFQKPGKKETVEEKLKAHQSSEERYPFYEEIYTKIIAMVGTPKSILDLGCGANPYSYDYLGCEPEYIAVDLPNDELQRIMDFFKEKGIKGDAYGIDLVKEYEKLGALMEHNHVDVAFLFKLLDSLETIKRHISGKVLDAVNATWLIVSFPTISIGGKKHIKKERRAWFEKLLKRKDWNWQEFDVGNEAFYVIRKEKKD
ncbi:hypothetical protein GOV07_00295 [Candidatus Woesearchaeota archaeon]|nr:hypothetical protein [Candidatus Woesearchaeota archaeon]